jgi:hypothetical protein
MYITRTGRLILIMVVVLLLAAGCGGGSGGGTNPPPPPPPTGVTYTVQLTGVNLVDTRSAADVDPTGLPIAGATATRQP